MQMTTGLIHNANSAQCIFIYIYLKQKSLKSTFIWRHLNIMIHKQNSLKSFYMMAQSLTRNLSGYALYRVQMNVQLLGRLDSLMALLVGSRHVTSESFEV